MLCRLAARHPPHSMNSTVLKLSHVRRFPNSKGDTRKILIEQHCPGQTTKTTMALNPNPTSPLNSIVSLGRDGVGTYIWPCDPLQKVDGHFLTSSRGRFPCEATGGPILDLHVQPSHAISDATCQTYRHLTTQSFNGNRCHGHGGKRRINI